MCLEAASVSLCTPRQAYRAFRRHEHVLIPKCKGAGLWLYTVGLNNGKLVEQIICPDL